MESYYDNHPQDAYELGKAAVVRLKEHNEELSYVLPQQLQTLFNDTEFREAIGGSGVVTDELQSLTPISAYQMTSSHPSPRSKTRKSTFRRAYSIQTTPTADPLIPASKWSSSDQLFTATATVQMLVPLPPATQSSSTASESHFVYHSSIENDVILTTANNAKVLPKFDDPVRTNLRNSTGLSTSASSQNAEPINLLVADPSRSEEFRVTVHDADGAHNNCFCCSNQIHQTTRDISEQQRLQRDLFWISLGLNKFSNTNLPTFQFCDNCATKLNMLLVICQRIGSLEDEFNDIRLGLCEGIVMTHVNKTKTEDYEAPFSLQQKAFLTSKIINRMQKDYLTLIPGKELLDTANNFSNVQESSELPKSWTSRATQTTSNNDDNEEIQNSSNQLNLECQYCKKLFRNKKSRAIHELNHTNKRQFHCDKCGKVFTTQDSFRSHLRDMHRKKPLLCIYCDKKFKNHGNLTEHLHRHLAFRKFFCSICSERFYVMKNVKAHFSKKHSTITDVQNYVKKLSPNEQLPGAGGPSALRKTSPRIGSSCLS